MRRHPFSRRSAANLQHWRDRTIYLILIDRFFNGDPSNDDFGKGEYDLASDDGFHGGDLKGILRKLPHIRRMGFDAVWITPPVHNQWINPYIGVRGYHGYWAYDFTRIDPHFGTLEDYKRLVREAHGLGLKVIQDIVVNHTGNYFSVEARNYDPARPERNWKAQDGAFPPESSPKAPNDPVFRMNNPNLPEHKKAAVYNFTPNISDFNDRKQTLNYSLGDLDDINLKSPTAVERLKEIYRYWMDEVGIDGFRVDTAYYTPEEFYETFLYDKNPKSPGIVRHARAGGLSDFFVFGEVWSYNYRVLNRYVEGRKAPRLDSVIDMPLNETLARIFYRRAPTQELRRALEQIRRNRPLWINFLDNHDTERIVSRAGPEAARQSLVALFTLPGIPCIYYGTEAGLKKPRQDMFRGKYFDQRYPFCVFLKGLIRLRKRHAAFRRGKCRVERSSDRCGLLEYSISWKNSRYRVVFNTSPDAAFYESGAANRGLKPLLSSESGTILRSPLLPSHAYRVLQELPARSGARTQRVRSRIAMLPVQALGKGIIRIRWRLNSPAAPAGLFLLSDDNYGKRIPIDPTPSGSADLDTATLGNGRHRLRLVARMRMGGWLSSGESILNVRNPYRLLRCVLVPRRNKGGPGGKIHPPADPSYGRQLDMEETAVYTSGKDLRLKIRMSELTTDWNPPLGFDHVYFSVFFDFPGQRGKKFLPKLGYARKDFEFNAGFLIHGWGTRSFGARDSAKDAYGLPLIGETTVRADPKTRTVALTFSEDFFETLKSFSGTKIFISTWDGYLGELRAVSNLREDWNFHVLNGSSVRKTPKIFDHILIPL